MRLLTALGIEQSETETKIVVEDELFDVEIRQQYLGGRVNRRGLLIFQVQIFQLLGTLPIYYFKTELFLRIGPLKHHYVLRFDV
jgi:AAA+ superfamily predicted ATPase